MGESTLKTCFIAAPLGADTLNLRRALAARGVNPWEVADLLAGDHAPETVESAINDADFVCGVIPRGPAPATVYLELGMALGVGRPLLLFVEPGAELPVSLRQQPYARTSLSSAEGLDSHIDTFLKHAGKNRGPRRSAPSSHRRGPAPLLMDSYLDQLAAWETQQAPPSEHEIVLYVADVLEAAGYLAATARDFSDNDARPDIAVWIDELHTTIGNPLAIEVVADDGRLMPSVDRFQRNLKEQHSPLGLLIMWHRPDQFGVQGELPEPIVVVMSVREFVEAVGNGGLARVLLNPRNAVIQSAA
jgi:hypothetical protein